MGVDRVANWKKFSQHMEEYIRECTVEKYRIENSGGFNLMASPGVHLSVCGIYSNIL